MTNINNWSKVLSIKNSSKQKEGKKNRKGASQMIFSVYFYKTVITLTRGKFPPFCLLAGSCCTRSNIRYRENTATQKIAPPHTVTCFLSFILLQNLLSNLKKKMTLTFGQPNPWERRKNEESTNTGMDVSTLLLCVQPHCRAQHCAMVVLVEDESTKSAIAGKQTVSLGQNTATGGWLFQSSPCASPSKLIKLQERKNIYIFQRKVQTGTPVSLQHGDMYHCRIALQFPSPLPHQL